MIQLQRVSGRSPFRSAGRMEKTHPVWHTVRIILILLAAASLILNLFLPDTPAGEWLSRHVPPVVTGVLAFLTSFFPFSVAEFGLYVLVLLVPLLLVFCIVHVVRSRERGRVLSNILINILCIISVIHLVFFWSYSVCYNRWGVERSLGFERRPLSADELYETTAWLLENANACAEELGFSAETGSSMPYSFRDMGEKLKDDYRRSFGDNPMFSHIYVRPKPVLWSSGMSRISLTGMFVPFTGEANVNVDHPDFVIPYTAAHEMSHQNGIAREEEANFAAFLVCQGSEDPFIRYSGYINALINVGNALYRASGERYAELYYRRSDRVQKDLQLLSDYIRGKDGPLGDFASDVNDQYLKAHGQKDGVASYGRMPELVVGWYQQQIAGQAAG